MPDAHNAAPGVSPTLLCVGGSGVTLDVYDLRNKENKE